MNGKARRDLLAAFTAHVRAEAARRGVKLDTATTDALDDACAWASGDHCSAGFRKTIGPVLGRALAAADVVDVLGWLVEDTRRSKREGSYYTEDDVARFVARTAVAGALLDQLAPLLGGVAWQSLTRAPEGFLRLPGQQEPLPGEPPLQARQRLVDRRAQLELLSSGAVSTARQALAAGVQLDRLLLAALAERMVEDPTVPGLVWDALGEFLVADLSAGSGQLLLPSLELLHEVYRTVSVPGDDVLSQRLATHVLAADRDDVALHAAALRLALLVTCARAGESPLTDVIRKAFAGRTQVVDLLWEARRNPPEHMTALLPRADVILGNPPYLANTYHDRIHPGWRTRGAPDVCALFVEQAVAVTPEEGWLGLVLPLSVQSTRGYAATRALLADSYSAVSVASFSRRPSSLFPRAGVRTALVLGAGRLDREPGSTAAEISVTPAYRWTPAFRPHLFDSVVFRALPRELASPEGWSRLPSAELGEVFARLMREHPQGLASVLDPAGPCPVGFRGNALYELTAFTPAEAPQVRVGGQLSPQTMMRWLGTTGEDDQHAVLAVLLSSFALVWWHCHGDDLNVTRRTLERTPLDLRALDPARRARLVGLGRQLRRQLPHVRTETLYAGRRVQGYAIRDLRPLTGQVDRLLAEAFGYVNALPALAHAYEGVTRGLAPSG